MSCFNCSMCDELKHTDFHGCFEDPKNPYGCLCYECHLEISEGENENV